MKWLEGMVKVMGDGDQMMRLGWESEEDGMGWESEEDGDGKLKKKG